MASMSGFQEVDTMTHYKKLAAAAVIGIVVTVLLWLLSPQDMRPQATIAMVAIWGAVIFSWGKANARQRVFAVAFAGAITLISLLAFLSFGNAGLGSR
jgi:small basic protein